MAGWVPRPGRLGDVAAVLALERETSEAPHWSEKEYLAIVSGGSPVRRCLIVSEAESGLLGFAVGSVLAAQRRGELESVVVAVSARRLGVGRALCAAVMAWCRKEGASHVELEVRAGSAGAIALYQELGFVTSGRRPGYYAQPVEDAMLMSSSVEPVDGGK